MFISSDCSIGAVRSVAAASTARTDCRQLVRGRQMTGGKGAKGGNLDSLGNTGPADDVAKRRKPAETGGNPFWEPHSGTKEFLGARIRPPSRAVGDWRIACGNCGNPHDESHRGLASALRDLRNLQVGNRLAVAEIAEIAKAVVIFGSKGRKPSPPAPMAVGKNSRSPQFASARYRVVPLLGRRVCAASGRRPRCLTGVGVAPILPHRKNGLKSRKHKAF